MTQTVTPSKKQDWRRTQSRVCLCLFVLGIVGLILGSVFHCQLSELLAIFISANLFFLLIASVFSTNLKTLMVGIAALCVSLSVWTTDWPLKLRFQLSKSSFEKVLNDFQDGEEIEVPRMVGLYRVTKVTHIYKGTEREAFKFHLNSIGDFHGFAFCPDKVSFNIWTHIPMDDQWHFLIVD